MQHTFLLPYVVFMENKLREIEKGLFFAKTKSPLINDSMFDEY